jgi:hypothetical protein
VEFGKGEFYYRLLTHSEVYVKTYMYFVGYFHGKQPLLGQCLLIIETSQLHSDISQSVELLRTSDQPDAETFT